jgi:hypothetical protein
MKFILQVRFNEAHHQLERLSGHEQQTIFAEYIAVGQTPGVLDGNQLQPADTATTVQVRDGKIETTEVLPIHPAGTLDGYYLYEATDVHDAIELAARIPAARMGGTIEVRPIVER